MNTQAKVALEKQSHRGANTFEFKGYSTSE